MDGNLSRMMEQVQKLIEDRFVIDNFEEKTTKMVQLQMEKTTNHVAAKVMERGIQLVYEKLVVVHGGTRLTQEAS